MLKIRAAAAAAAGAVGTLMEERAQRRMRMRRHLVSAVELGGINTRCLSDYAAERRERKREKERKGEGENPRSNPPRRLVD